MVQFAKTGSFSNIITSEDCVRENEIMTDKTKSVLYFILKKFKEITGLEWNDVLPLSGRTETPEFKMRSCIDVFKFLTPVKEEFRNFDVKRNPTGFSVTDWDECVFKVSIGEGSRTNKSGGGKKGMTFEDILYNQLTSGETNETTSKIREIVGNRTDWVKCGSKNQRRSATFENGILTFGDSTDIGHIVSDISTGDGSHHLSLKYGDQYYLINVSLRKLLRLDEPEVYHESRDKLLRYLGFSPKSFCEPYGIESRDIEWDSYDDIIDRWRLLLSDIIGRGYVYVVGGEGFETVLNFSESPEIIVDRILPPVYAEEGIRKYSNITLLCKISGLSYKICAQFRGSESKDKYPIYMRILAKKIKE